MPSLLTVHNTVASKLRGKVKEHAQIASRKEKNSLSKNEQKRRAKAAEQDDLKVEKLEKVKEREEEARKSVENRLKEFDDVSEGKYGNFKFEDRPQRNGDAKPVEIEDITASLVGKRVVFKGRIQTDRPQSTMLQFYLFRHKGSIIQGVLQSDEKTISPHMVRWAEGLPRESIVLVEGIVQKPPKEQGGEVKTATIHDAEVKIEKMFVVSTATSLPFNLQDAVRPESDFEKEDFRGSHITQPTRLEHRLFDLRTITNHSIFRINSGVCRFFRTFLDSQGFIEIHTPKLQGSATESGASVFKVDYFKRTAFLAQSPQLAKQMCISADMERVYEVGPVFRAENSNTHRHLTEYTGLDLEMALPAPYYDYHDALSVIDGMFRSIFVGLAKEYAADIERVGAQFPASKFEWNCQDKEETLVLKFVDAVKMLREAGREQEEDEDLDTPTEKFLGKLVKEKYGTDYYVLDKFPASARPFYTMPDAKDNRYTNSFDIFMRGEEILSGGQRIHDADMLASNLGKSGIDPEDLKEYMDGFRLGVEPHAGGGIGLERVVMLYLNLGNIRWASLFPRDPKSLPEKQKKLVLKTTAHPMNDNQGAPREFQEDKFGHRIEQRGAMDPQVEVTDEGQVV